MDLYPYLNFFKEYFPPNFDTFYPELNDLDLLINVSSETEKDIITQSLNESITRAQVDSSFAVTIHTSIKDNYGITLDFSKLTDIINKMSFKTVKNSGLDKYVIRGALLQPDRRYDVFVDINTLLPYDNDSKDFDPANYRDLYNSKFKVLDNKYLLDTRIDLISKPKYEKSPEGLGFLKEYAAHAEEKVDNWRGQVKLLTQNPSQYQNSYPISDKQIDTIYAILVFLNLINIIGLEKDFYINGGFVAHLYAREFKNIISLDEEATRLQESSRLEEDRLESERLEKERLKDLAKETRKAEKKKRQQEIKNITQKQREEQKALRLADIKRDKAQQDEEKKKLQLEKSKQARENAAQKSKAKSKAKAQEKLLQELKETEDSINSSRPVSKKSSTSKSDEDELEEAFQLNNTIYNNIKRWLQAHREIIIKSGISITTLSLILYMIYHNFYVGTDEEYSGNLVDKNIFASVDNDISGLIDKTEYVEYIKGLFNPKTMEIEDFDSEFIQVQFDKHDKDKSGYISPQEFVYSGRPTEQAKDLAKYAERIASAKDSSLAQSEKYAETIASAKTSKEAALARSVKYIESAASAKAAAKSTEEDLAKIQAKFDAKYTHMEKDDTLGGSVKSRKKSRKKIRKKSKRRRTKKKK